MIAAALGLLVAAGPAPIRRVDTEEPMLAFTFDACATRRKTYGFDRPVFDILKREQIPATVFVSGRWLEAHPAEARELAAEPLVEFGNHSWDHPRMSRLSRRRMADEIARTGRALAELGKGAVAFRPPFGDLRPAVIEVARAQGLPTVTWDVVSGDPGAKTARQIERNVLRRARPGSIVIFHINGRKRMKTALALPAIIAGLRARGLRFVALSQLLAGPAPAAVGVAAPPPEAPVDIPGVPPPAAPPGAPRTVPLPPASPLAPVAGAPP